MPGSVLPGRSKATEPESATDQVKFEHTRYVHLNDHAMFILNGALVALDRLSGSRPGSLWPDNLHRRAPYPHALRVIALAPPSPRRAHSLQRTPLTVRRVFWQAGSFQHKIIFRNAQFASTHGLQRRHAHTLRVY